MQRTIATLMVLGFIGGCSGTKTTEEKDTEAPVVSISAPTSVEGGETIALVVSVKDNVDAVLTPTLSCTGNGTLTGSMLATPVVATDTTITCTGTATDAAGNVGTGSFTIQVKATVSTVALGEGQASLSQGQAGLLVASNLPLTETSYQGMLNGRTVNLYRAGTTGLSFLVPSDLAPGAYRLSVAIGTRTYSFPLTVAAVAGAANPKSVVSQTLIKARTNIDDFLSANGASMTGEQRGQYLAYRQIIVNAITNIDAISQAELDNLAKQFLANSLTETASAAGSNNYTSRYVPGLGKPDQLLGVYNVVVCNRSSNLYVVKNVASIALLGVAAVALRTPGAQIIGAVALATAFTVLNAPGGVLSEVSNIVRSCFGEQSFRTIFDSNFQTMNRQAQYVSAITATTATGFRNRQPANLRIEQTVRLDPNIAPQVTANLALLRQVLASLPYTPDSVTSALNTIVPEKTEFVPSAEVSLAAISPAQVTGTKSGSGDVVTLTFSAEPSEQNIDFAYTLLRTNGTPIPMLGTLIVAVPGADDAAFVANQGKTTETTVTVRGADSIEIVSPPANGVATIAKEGLLRYTPNGQYFGNDVITFRARNANGVSRTATVSITVVRNFAGQWRVTSRTATTSKSPPSLSCPDEVNEFPVTVSKITDTQYTVSYQGFPLSLTMSGANDPAGLSGSTTVTYPDDDGLTTATLNIRIPDSTRITGDGTFSYVGPENSRCAGTTSITGVR